MLAKRKMMTRNNFSIQRKAIMTLHNFLLLLFCVNLSNLWFLFLFVPPSICSNLSAYSQLSYNYLVFHVPCEYSILLVFFPHHKNLFLIVSENFLLLPVLPKTFSFVKCFVHAIFNIFRSNHISTVQRFFRLSRNCSAFNSIE